jgi:thermostable 8-oxoguanine DNA glycosylase
MGENVGRQLTESEMFDGLRQTAAELGISATALDTRIWYYMQGRSPAQVS